MISDPYKLISYSDRERQRVVYEPYELRNDPEKMEDLSAVGKQVVAGLKAEMAARLDVKKPAPLEKNADRG